MAEPARTTVKDDIAIRRRPENARSVHSTLAPNESDGRARGMRDAAGPRPDPAEAEIAAHGGVDPDHPGTGPADALRRKLGVRAVPPGTPEHIAVKIRRIETLADWLDTRFVIPVINWPVGLDGIVGLIPGVGDTITTGLSGYLIYEAHRAGARTGTLAKMGWHVAVDWVLGSIPLVGDIFDVAHKANAKNARLLLAELHRSHTDMKLKAAERGAGP